MPHESILSGLSALTARQLAAGCRHQQADRSHEPFCFELFRRALAEKSQEAWQTINQQYERLVRSWIVEFAQTSNGVGNSSLDELTADAFYAFWRSYTAEKLQKALGLASVLAFLKSCAVTSVLQAKRKQRRSVQQTELIIEGGDAAGSERDVVDAPARSFLQGISAAELWQIVDACCGNEQERVIVRLSFVSDLKPRSILELHPGLFVDVEEVYTIRRNLKNRLARDRRLRTLWEAGDE
jgi:DNA-directed RNA polymerase specialized sigma24 family protein